MGFNSEFKGLSPSGISDLSGNSSRDGHAEGEHVNRGRDTPRFCPTLQLLDVSTLLCLSVFFVAQPIWEVPEGLMNYSIYSYIVCLLYLSN